MSKLKIDYKESLLNAQKCIAELEKDKAYAEEQLDEQIQATLKLQKENAELKAVERMALYSKLLDQLTKAQVVRPTHQSNRNN